MDECVQASVDVIQKIQNKIHVHFVLTSTYLDSTLIPTIERLGMYMYTLSVRTCECYYLCR